MFLFWPMDKRKSFFFNPCLTSAGEISSTVFDLVSFAAVFGLITSRNPWEGGLRDVTSLKTAAKETIFDYALRALRKLFGSCAVRYNFDGFKHPKKAIPPCSGNCFTTSYSNTY